MNNASELLVSVRSASEALRALAGGAALIDVKEPLRGALGRATDDVIGEVVGAVGAVRPVSAALGEWEEAERTIPPFSLTYVKWGLAGCGPRQDWRTGLARMLQRQEKPRIVLTAYADWECAGAPAIEEVFALAREHPDSVVMLDTCCKDASQSSLQRRPTLLDWLSVAGIEDWCARCREARIRIALAGSLGEEEIEQLLPARPDWFAVRGAVCDAGDRHAAVQIFKVRRLAELLRHAVGGPV
jgi:uncharacterized protein (UPF0264 family)